MNATAVAIEYLAKAERALVGAKLLLQAGDLEGACSRAYYAMFDAARAALVAVNAPNTETIHKTHAGLIAAFGRHLVQSGLVEAELGRSLNQVESLRLLADYAGDTIEPDRASWAIGAADRFVRTVADRLASGS
jgi:uncharacterized protein (UPF0332 family)